ncbi:MAG: hypothetical protein ACYDH1_07600 [Anaerolineaceae bacterium]|jgi:hypothetical protein|nr:MAG: hypothetical protein CVU46_08345 [Chloroflexi bacterium HGW-Chloroflexi-8]
MKTIPALVVAVLSGFIVLIGLFFPIPILINLKSDLLNLSITVGAFALIIAIINLISVHWSNIFSNPQKSLYSSILIIGFLCVFFTGIVLGPDNSFFIDLSSTVIFSVETSMFALLCFSLAIACFKLFTKRKNGLAIIFAISTIIFLFILSGILANDSGNPIIKPILSVFNELPIAGARGILLGVSIGAIVTGIRVLIGIERPYNG